MMASLPFKAFLFQAKNLVHQYSALISERKRQNKAAHRRSVLPKIPDMGPAKAHGSLSKFANIVAPSLKDNDNLNDEDIVINGSLLIERIQIQMGCRAPSAARLTKTRRPPLAWGDGAREMPGRLPWG